MPPADVSLDSTELEEGAPPSPLLRTRRGRFVLHGEDIHLFGVGPVVPRPDSEGAERALVDRLAELTTNRVRFQLRIETWAFCFEPGALSPWAAAESDTGLNRFDPTFWTRAVELARYAGERGVLVEFVLFDTAALRPGPRRTGWWRNPLNSALGGPIEPGSAMQFYQMTGSDSALNALVKDAVRAFGNLTNVTWELISSLDGADPVRAGFVSHFVDLLREADPLDRLVSVSVANPKRTDSAIYSLQGVDAAGFDWRDGELAAQGFAETVATLRRFGKPVVNHRARPARDEAEADRFERERVLAAIEAGGHTIARPETVLPETAAWLRELVSRLSAEHEEDKEI